MSTARRFFSWCPAKQKHGRGKSILRPPMCKNVVLLGLGHSARKSRKSHKSRKLRKSFGGYRLNHVQSRKSRKCCRPERCLRMYVCDFSGRFLLLRMWRVHMLVLSVLLYFCNAWYPHGLFPRFQFVRCLSNNPFPLCVWVLLSRCHCPMKACCLFRPLRFELQTSKQSVRSLFFKTQKCTKRWHTHTPRRRHDEQVFAYLAALPAMHIVPTRLHT